MFDLKRNAAILLLALIGTAGFAGCGGDDEEPVEPAPVEEPVESPTLTMNELINEGDSYCAEANAAVGTISESTADDSIKQSQIAGIYSGLADDLESLGAPTEGDAPTDVIEAAEALSESDSTTADSALTTFQSAADTYGFVECGEAPAAPASSSSGSSTDVPSDTGGSTGGYVEPAPAPVEPAPVPVEPAPVDPGTGGGVAPAPPADPGTGGSGGSGSGGISPG